MHKCSSALFFISIWVEHHLLLKSKLRIDSRKNRNAFGRSQNPSTNPFYIDLSSQSARFDLVFDVWPVQFLSSMVRAKPLSQRHLKLPIVFRHVPWVHRPLKTLHSFTSAEKHRLITSLFNTDKNPKENTTNLTFCVCKCFCTLVILGNKIAEKCTENQKLENK